MHGKLNNNESPKIAIKLAGMLGEPQPFNVIIDTGFTGQITMPWAKALPLGLVLFSVGSSVLADGSTIQNFLCLGKATIENITQEVIISLSTGNDILVGTELLKSFKMKLELNYQDETFELTLF